MPFSKSIDRVYTRPLLVPRYYRGCLPLRIVLRFAFLLDRDQSCQHYLTILIIKKKPLQILFYNVVTFFTANIFYNKN